MGEEELKFKLVPVDELQPGEERVTLLESGTPVTFTLQPAESGGGGGTAEDLKQRLIELEQKYYDLYNATRLSIPTPVGYNQNPKNVATLPQPTLRSPDPDVVLDNVYVSWDLETSGTKPWESRLLGSGAIVIGKPYSELFQSFSFDEEQIVVDTLDYFDDVQPDALVGWNIAFEMQWFTSRCLYFQHKFPWAEKCKIIDAMILFKHGTWQKITSSMAAGSEENWLQYLYDIQKPYEIDECFEDLAKGSLLKLMLRNRSCVTGVADMFILFCWVTDQHIVKEVRPVATVPMREDAIQSGRVFIQCPVCMYRQEVQLGVPGQKCVICGNELPVPTAEMGLEEKIREFDIEAFAASLKKEKK